ncbi:MAG TPA: leucine--tRNA ligase [Candidatus Dormibacteraeota bacterium]|nr:leucine--tRNA ligase [Candidatus Dormibacteraeota bacterium]
MKRYNPKDIEPKWQKKWEADKIYQASEDRTKPKKYVLEYFPYPSGAAMHVGHVRNYTIGDAIARFNRMKGFNVLHPMGWDAFGLPAENYAIKNKVSPRKAIDENTDRFKQQLIQMGFSYDWTREIDSTDPKYYRWTQWFFLLLLKRGLAYQQEALVNWDPVDKTVLANEQIIDGRAERSGAIVEKKSLKQWFFKITDYADRLEQDLDHVNWSQSIKVMQRNWIGRSKGMIFTAPVKDSQLQIQTFSAHFEAFAADTFVVIAPDHPFLKDLLEGTPDEKKVLDFAAKMVKKRDSQGYADEENVEGIFTGRYIEDPVGNGDLPIWVASYALAHYGTGIVKCSAHDERDFRFAKKYDIGLKPVLFPKDEAEAEKVRNLEYCYNDMQHGILAEPQAFAGQVSGEIREPIIKYLEDEQLAVPQVSYKMRDWLISRQRYWGAPIPIIHCPQDGAVPVPEDQLPVVLPEVKSYEPSGDGRSPLANVPEFVNTTCPKCGGAAKRETDTMDGFACSSWYFLRFADPHNDKEPFSKDLAKFWLPVDDYIGGAEHAVMHLLYARFWTKVMYDEGLIEFEEPFTTLRNQGMILAPDGAKMSKSKNNTIEPDSIIEQGYGADSVRIMELFIGPWNQASNWSVEGMGGAFRFLQRIWTLVQEFNDSDGGSGESAELQRSVHKTIKKVSQDLSDLSFNTAIAAQMECVNDLYRVKAEDNYGSTEWQWALESLVQLVAPFAPHIAEELWQQLGQDESVHTSTWPEYDEKYLVEDTVTIVIQINGKLRGEIQVAADSDEATVVAAAKANEKAGAYLKDQTIRKTIYVPSKLVNFVV